MSLLLKYQLKEPKEKKDKNPLILLLHGYGSNEEDLFTFSKQFPDEYYVVSARAPHDLPYGGYAWFALYLDENQKLISDNGQAAESRETIVKFIDELTDMYPNIDKNNISLVGFSQGSILSLALALSHPTKVQKVVALSGYLNTDILKEDYQQNNFSNLKVFQSHGTEDEVIPVEWARKSTEILKPLQINHTYKEYPAGHTITPENFLDFRSWLLGN